MADVDVAPSNGYDHESAPTPDEYPPDLNGGSEDGDLFGDEDDNLVDDDNNQQRQLDDSELDSGDDQGRTDRVADTVEDEEQVEDYQTKLLNADIARVKPPEGDELYLLHMPPFLGLNHRNFDPVNYKIPEQPHDGRDPETDPDVKYSPFSTAMSTIYWRRDPKTKDLLQSNARIVRWSDGSLTLQLASKPQDQYRISTTALRQSFGRKRDQPQPDYDPNKDTHNYLAAPHVTTGVDLQIVAPLDAAMRIQPTGDLADESVLKLQKSLAAATQIHDPLAALKQVKEDPELAKKKAELFEKDRMRTARKREAAEDRLIVRKDRVLGRSGLGRSGGYGAGGGLSVAGLEDDDGMPTARGTKSSKMKRRQPNRRGDIYSDDEDEDNPRRRTREDEYDREDDFLAASDEEPETYEDEEEEEVLEDGSDDPDVDDLEIEGRQTVIPDREPIRDRDRDRKPGGAGGGRSTTPKRSAVDDDVDAEAEDDDGVTAPTAGSPQVRKKRRVIDDDDEDE